MLGEKTWIAGDKSCADLEDLLQKRQSLVRLTPMTFYSSIFRIFSCLCIALSCVFVRIIDAQVIINCALAMITNPSNVMYHT